MAERLSSSVVVVAEPPIRVARLGMGEAQVRKRLELQALIPQAMAAAAAAVIRQEVLAATLVVAVVFTPQLAARPQRVQAEPPAMPEMQIVQRMLVLDAVAALAIMAAFTTPGDWPHHA
jgi:hypothetical protein